MLLWQVGRPSFSIVTWRGHRFFSLAWGPMLSRRKMELSPRYGLAPAVAERRYWVLCAGFTCAGLAHILVGEPRSTASPPVDIWQKWG